MDLEWNGVSCSMVPDSPVPLIVVVNSQMNWALVNCSPLYIHMSISTCDVSHFRKDQCFLTVIVPKMLVF